MKSKEPYVLVNMYWLEAMENLVRYLANALVKSDPDASSDRLWDLVRRLDDLANSQVLPHE